MEKLIPPYNVRCVSDNVSSRCFGLIKKGEIYTVIQEYDLFGEMVVLFNVPCPDSNAPYGWNAARFEVLP